MRTIIPFKSGIDTSVNDRTILVRKKNKLLNIKTEPFVNQYDK